MKEGAEEVLELLALSRVKSSFLFCGINRFLLINGGIGNLSGAMSFGEVISWTVSQPGSVTRHFDGDRQC